MKNNFYVITYNRKLQDDWTLYSICGSNSSPLGCAIFKRLGEEMSVGFNITKRAFISKTPVEVPDEEQLWEDVISESFKLHQKEMLPY